MDELCNVAGCLYDAAFYPVLKVYSRHSNDAAEIKLEHPTCLSHSNTMTLDDLLPGTSWDRLVNAGFTQYGLTAPMKERTTVEWVSIQLKENDEEATGRKLLTTDNRTIEQDGREGARGNT